MTTAAVATKPSDASLLYNGRVETAGRMLVLVRRLGPLSLSACRVMDIFLTYPADLGAPVNLHLPRAARGNPWNFRQPAIVSAFGLLADLGLAAPIRDGWKATANVSETVYIATEYGEALDASASWLQEAMETEGRRKFMERARARLKVLLQADPYHYPTQDDLTKFKDLQISYRTDLRRLEFMEVAAEWMLGIATDAGSEIEPAYFADVRAAAVAERAKVRAQSRGLAGLISDLEAKAA